MADALFASVAGQAVAMSSREALFRDAWTRRTHVLPLAAVDALDRCRAFLPFEQHVANVTAVYPPNAAASIRQGLVQLREKALLIDHASWLSRFARGGETPALRAIFIRTCDRPTALDRLLASLAEVFRAAGRTYRVVVLDDSRDTANGDANAARLRRFGDETGAQVRMFGADDRARFASQLPASVGTLLTGAGGETFGGGRNFNLASLLGTGAAYALLDDDFVFPLRRLHPDAPVDPSGHRYTESRFYATRDAAVAAGEAVTGDPFAFAAQSLGRGLGSLLPHSSDALVGFEPGNAAHLRFDAKIAAVTQGHRGDAGTQANHWMFLLDGESRHSLWRDGRGYAGNRDGNALWFGGDRPRIEPHPVMTPFLVDATDGAPPTRPSGRSEDELFGLLLHALDPRRVSLHAATTIGHCQVDARQRAATTASNGVAFNRWLVETINNITPDVHATGVARHRSFAARLRDLAEAGDDTLQDSVTRYTRALTSDFAVELERARMAADGAPPDFIRDLDQALVEIRRVVASEEPTRIADWPALTAAQMPAAMRAELARFADALADWPEALDRARTLAPTLLGSSNP